MKLITLAVFIFLIIMSANAQTNTFPSTGSAGIGTTAPDISSVLEMKSTTQGMLVPRMKEAQRNAIVSPATGLLIYQTNASVGFYYYNGSSWTAVSPKGVSKTLNNLTAPTAINLSLVPGADSSIDLGSLPNQWKTLYLGQSIYLDGTIFMHTGFGTHRGANTYLGREAGLNDIGNGSNTGIGFRSLFNNTTGYYNTATGVEALHTNSTGTGNTALGFAALHFNLKGENNVAVGINTLYSNNGYNNVATGFETMSLNTTGSFNVASGSHALQFNTTGYSNVAIGADALSKSAVNSNNVAIGDSALMNNGFGASSLTQGANNTAVGSKSGTKLTTGNNSTFIGWQSGYNSTTANANTAVGSASLFSNTTGNDNVAMGVEALQTNTTGSYNTIIGKGAGYANTTGSANVSLGVRSLFSNISGTRNTALGDSAGFTNKGNYNTFLGAYADVTTSGLTSATAIGYNAKVSTSNTIVIGDAATPTNVAIGATTAGIYKLRVSQGVGSFGFDLFNAASSNHWEHYVTNSAGSTVGGDAYTAGDMLLYYNSGGSPVGAFDHTSGIYRPTSDERMKTNIKPMTSILDKINLLEPVTYNFKSSSNPNVSMGFIAQKVEKIFPSLVSHYADTARGTDVNLMDYSGFGVIAIKGIQELQQQMQAKDDIINTQQKEIDDLKSMMLRLQQSVASLQTCSPCNGQASSSDSRLSTQLSSAVLFQNVPNPFSNTTSINYSLPQKYSSAKIIITDKNGKVLKQLNLFAGKGSINIDAATLSSGAYQYSLIVDGKMIDTKQMVAVK